MKKILISIIASCMILFVVWAFMILIRYNFNVQGVRFSLQRTFQQITNINEQNFVNLIDDIRLSITSYNLVIETYQNSNNVFTQLFGGLSSSTMFLGLIGEILFAVFKYLLAVLQMFFQIIGFMFNPITY